MKNIVAQLTANNQVKIRYVNRPNCLKPKQAGDLSDAKSRERIAWMQLEVERINRILSHGCKEYKHTNYLSDSINGQFTRQLSLPGFSGRTEDVRYTPYELSACDISSQVEYFDSQAGRIVKESYESLVSQKRRALDIISKNQQAKKTERSWGKPQKLKRFTLNAKQQILEAGAVVDRDCGADSSFELTLTIPGSGYEVYRVVSEWSGWIVNRQTQVIRRLEAKGIQVYWFFVWEHQKRGALHQHWCVAIPENPMLADWLARQIRRKWWDLLEELSEKTSIDLFAKKGSFGTWRHSPEVWQSSISPIRKSVAAYFSKYASKNADTSKYNERRRDFAQNSDKRCAKDRNIGGVITLCPSRYWGSGSRVKNRVRELRITIEFTVFSSKQGDWLRDVLLKWVGEVSTILSEVSRRFEVLDPKTDFIYARGWEQRVWFNKNAYDKVFTLFQRIKLHPLRSNDAIGAIADLMNI